MSDSKKLPTIEVGDTVVFRTDLVVNEYYGAESFEPNMVRFVNRNQVVSTAFTHYFQIKGGNGWYFTPEMVTQVIKPSKARVYSESELIDFANSYADQVMGGMVKRADEYFNQDYKSLNTEGK